MADGKTVKLCFAASSGGHYEQLLMLKPLMDKYESFVVTEKTSYSANIEGEQIYYMHQVNRKEKTFLFWMVINLFKSLGIIIKERPKVIITTGVLAMIPLCILVKLCGGKLIFISNIDGKINV
jgi:UDP-N-acetylglucosamine:LPS N-acetylglucosamine transferase